MKERQNNLDNTLLLSGVSYGEHKMDAENIINELIETVGNFSNTFIVRCNPNNPLSKKSYVDIAKFAKERDLHFGFLYAYQFPPKGKRSHLTKEIISSIESICGDLFLGEFFGEAGSDKAAKDKGYYVEGSEVLALQMPPQNRESMDECSRFYHNFIKEMTDYDKSIGLDNTFLVEPTALQRDNLIGGIKTPILEVFPANAENLIPFTRGSAIGFERGMWGSFIAHEWYAGYRHEDELKIKRLELMYKYLYMQGSNLLFLESGNNEIQSYGYDLKYEDKLCKNYRDALTNFYKFIKDNPRLKYGPYTKVAFVQGKDDGYTDFLGGSVWCQFDRKEWGKSDAERSWKILEEVYRSDDWHNPSCYAHEGIDLSSSPCYGNYDVIPIESSIEVLKNYDYLIFVGWNSMTKETYDKFEEYVKGGGILFSTTAHLNTNTKRNGEYKPYNNGDVSSLFGIKIIGEKEINSGVKFGVDSYIDNMNYPGTRNFVCDACYPCGFTTYSIIENVSAKERGYLCNSFTPSKGHKIPLVTENKLGKGVAVLMLTNAYPGNPAVYPLYRTLVKALLTSSHAKCDLKVYGSDRVRYSLFYEGDKERLYLLNTSLSGKSVVNVRYKEKDTEYILNSLELKIINL